VLRLWRKHTKYR